MLRRYSLLIVYFILFFVAFSKITFARVIINEFSVQPADKYDWVEIYAIDTTDISSWKLADNAGNFETFTQGTILNAGEFKVITQYQRLDNDDDTIYLKNVSDGNEDQISYGGSSQVCIPSESESIARIPDGGNTIDRVSTPTKGSSNNSATLAACPSPTPVPTSTPTHTPTPTSTPSPANSPTPTPTPSVKPTLTPTVSPNPTKKPNPTSEAAGGEIAESNVDVSGFRLDDKSGSVKDITSSTDVLGSSEENVSPFAYILLGLGLVFIIISIFLFIRHKNDTASAVE